MITNNSNSKPMAMAAISRYRQCWIDHDGGILDL
jgi:hypothetical protein